MIDFHTLLLLLPLLGLFGIKIPGLGALGKLFKASNPVAGGIAGALGGLFGGGGLKGGALGALAGLFGGKKGVDPVLIGLLSGLGNKTLEEQKAQREAVAAALKARQDLLTRNLGLAEQTFADRQPLRNLGLGSIARFLGGAGSPSRGLFNFRVGQAPTPFGSEQLASLGALFGGLSGAPRTGSLLFGPGAAGGIAQSPVQPPLQSPRAPLPTRLPATSPRGQERRLLPPSLG